MSCVICGGVLQGRAVYRCHCGALTHAYCWEKHVVQSHRPPFVVGHLDLDGKFKSGPAAGGKAGTPERAKDKAQSKR